MAKRIIAILLAVMTLFMFTASAAAPGVEAAAKKPKKIVLDQEGTIKLNKGEKFELTYTLKPEGAESKVTWKSSNTKVAKVSKKGIVTARGEGKATITVTTKNGKKDTVKIKVTDPTKAKKIIVDEEVKTVVVGEKFKPGYTLVPETATSKVTVTSSKPKVVKVNKKGEATALKKGTAILTFTTSTGKKDTMKVKVVKAAPVPTEAPTATPKPTATPEPSGLKIMVDTVWHELYMALTNGCWPNAANTDEFTKILNASYVISDELQYTVGIAAEDVEGLLAAYRYIDPDFTYDEICYLIETGKLTGYKLCSEPWKVGAAIAVVGEDVDLGNTNYLSPIDQVFTKDPSIPLPPYFDDTPTPAPTATPKPTAAPAPSNKIVAMDMAWYEFYYAKTGVEPNAANVDEFTAILNGAGKLEWPGITKGIAAKSIEDLTVAYQFIDPTFNIEKMYMYIEAGLLTSYVVTNDPLNAGAAFVVVDSHTEIGNSRYLDINEEYFGREPGIALPPLITE